MAVFGGAGRGEGREVRGVGGGDPHGGLDGDAAGVRGGGVREPGVPQRADPGADVDGGGVGAESRLSGDRDVHRTQYGGVRAVGGRIWLPAGGHIIYKETMNIAHLLLVGLKWCAWPMLCQVGGGYNQSKSSSQSWYPLAKPLINQFIPVGAQLLSESNPQGGPGVAAGNQVLMD